jgi:hypothetical protein
MKQNTTSSNSKLILTLVLLVVIGIAVIVLVNGIDVDVNDERVKIKGIYGREIRIEDIEEVQIVEKIPFMGVRINGIGIGYINIGMYSYQDIGKVVVFKTTTSENNILIIGKEEKVLLGLGQRKNEELYNKIMKAIEVYKERNK